MYHKKRRWKLNEKEFFSDYVEIILYDRYDNEQARTKIDIDDIESVCCYRVSFHQKRASLVVNKKTILLHRFLLGDELKGKEHLDIDHINGQPLDNRRKNLRICTRSQNAMNQKNVLGISFNKKDKRWIARVIKDAKPIHLGSFIKKEDALEARRAGELKYFGEFSKHII